MVKPQEGEVFAELYIFFLEIPAPFQNINTLLKVSDYVFEKNPTRGNNFK